MAESRKILLVDDDEMVRELVAATLKGGSYQLLQAGDGGKGLQLAREQHPDLIFLDVNMPVMDGVSVCQALKGDPTTRDISVIMLTALGQEVDKERARRAGANGYFTKPFSPLTLLRKVDEVLGDTSDAG
ncbi:MAG TPA: response regulator [Chloroflexota bacterium]|nr:response regulator [Chloroflexota bacterium]